MVFFCSFISSDANAFSNDCSLNTSNEFCGQIGGITVDTTGWNDVRSGLGENKIIVDAKKITLQRICQANPSDPDCAIVERGGDVELVQSKTYSAAEMASGGLFDTERNDSSNAVYTFRNNTNDRWAIIVRRNFFRRNSGEFGNGPNTYNLNTSNGFNNYAKIRWPRAAHDQDGNPLDVEMTISNITVRLSDSSQKRISGIMLLEGNTHYSASALQERVSTDLNYNASTDLYTLPRFGRGGGSIGYFDGASYDITIKLYKNTYDSATDTWTSTNDLVDPDKSAMAMKFRDIDTYDGSNDSGNPGNSYWTTAPGAVAAGSSTQHITLNSSRTGANNRYLNQSGVPSAYAESITIKSGLIQNKIFTVAKNDETKTATDDNDGTELYFKPTSDGLHISGTNSSAGDDKQSSSFLALVDARGFTYRWAGTNCGTHFGFVGEYTVATGKEGDYTDKIVNLSATDTEVTWRENKQADFSITNGYYASKVTIDGTAWTPADLINNGDMSFNNQTYEYTFNDVISDHTYIVRADPHYYDICKVDATGNILSGAIFSLSGTSGGAAINLEDDTNIYAGITRDSRSDATHLVWESSSSCARLYALPNGTYTIQELEAPTGYIASGNIVFTVQDGEIISSTPASAKNGNNTINVSNQKHNDRVLRIGKTVQGTGGNINKSFTINFCIHDSGSVNTANGCSIPFRGQYTKYLLDGTTVNEDYGLSGTTSVNLKSGEYITISIDSTIAIDGYKVWESDYSSDNYTTTYEIEQNGSAIAPANIHYCDQNQNSICEASFNPADNHTIDIINYKDEPIITGKTPPPIILMCAISLCALIPGVGIKIRKVSQSRKT